MPLHFCPAPGCPALLPDGVTRCELHRHRERADVATLVKPWYASRRWRVLRLDVIRAEPFCRHCAELGRRVLTTDVDHIRKHGGDPRLFWDRDNLQGLCRSCHTRKTRAGE